MTPPDPSHSEVLVVSDSVNKDDNDVTAGDIITLCQPGGQKRALPGLPSCVGSSSRERERAQRLIYPFGFQFNSASLSAYSHIQILPVWGFVRRKTFWFVLPTLYLYYCLEWKHSVTLCRISGDLAPHSKSLTLFKMYCFHKDACAQPLSSLSPPVSSLFPSTSSSLILSFSLSLAYISICPLAGLRKKGLHEQALCHSGRVHQCAECARWSGLLWREDKEVSRKPAPRHPARSALLCSARPCVVVLVVFSFFSATLAGSLCQHNWV